MLLLRLTPLLSKGLLEDMKLSQLLLNKQPIYLEGETRKAVSATIAFAAVSAAPALVSSGSRSRPGTSTTTGFATFAPGSIFACYIFASPAFSNKSQYGETILLNQRLAPQ